MKDASGASQMDAKTQVSSLHGACDARRRAHSARRRTSAFALLHESGGENDEKLIDVAVAADVNLHGTPELAAAQAAREGGQRAQRVLAAAAALFGPNRQRAARRIAATWMIDRFAGAGLASALRTKTSTSPASTRAALRAWLFADTRDPRAEAMLAGAETERGAKSAFLVRWLGSLA